MRETLPYSIELFPWCQDIEAIFHNNENNIKRDYKDAISYR